ASAVDVPVRANMTEFGKSELFTADQLASAGVRLVIYPVTLLRLAMGEIERGLDTIRAAGTQAGLVDRMQTRARLYELIDYAGYNTFDSEIFTYSATEPTEGATCARTSRRARRASDSTSPRSARQTPRPTRTSTAGT